MACSMRRSLGESGESEIDDRARERAVSSRILPWAMSASSAPEGFDFDGRAQKQKLRRSRQAVLSTKRARTIRSALKAIEVTNLRRRRKCFERQG